MSERSEIRAKIDKQKAIVAMAETEIPNITAAALADDGVIDPDEAEKIATVEAELQRAKSRVAELIAEYEAVDREDNVSNPGQLTDIAGIPAVLPAVTLDAEGFLDGITAHLNFNYEVRKGSSRIAHGNFRSGGVVNLELLRDEEYTVIMTGSTRVIDTNLIMNDTSDSLAISCTWVVKPPLRDGGTHDPAVEIMGRPTLRPLSNIFMPDSTDWSIIVKDISVSQIDVSQVGIHVQYTLNGSSGDGGSISAGGFDVSSSNSVSTTTSASLSSVLRFTFIDPL